MDRRTFLKRGVVGGVLLMLGGGVGLYAVPTKHLAALPKTPLAVLEPRSFQVLVAVAGRVVTAQGADAADIAARADALLANAPEEVRHDINRLLMLFENALPGLLLDGRLLPFTRLSPEAQDAALLRWRDSSFALRRSGYHALRKVCLAAYYAKESSWPALGYAPPTGLNAMAYDDSKVGTPEWLASQGKGG